MTPKNNQEPPKMEVPQPVSAVDFAEYCKKNPIEKPMEEKENA